MPQNILSIKGSAITVPGKVLPPIVLDDHRFQPAPDGVGDPVKMPCGAPTQLGLNKANFLSLFQDGRVAQPYLARRIALWLEPIGYEPLELRSGNTLVGPEEEGVVAKDGTNRRKWGLKALTKKTGVDFASRVTRGAGRANLLPTENVGFDGYLVAQAQARALTG